MNGRGTIVATVDPEGNYTVVSADDHITIHDDFVRAVHPPLRLLLEVPGAGVYHLHSLDRGVWLGDRVSLIPVREPKTPTYLEN